MGMIDRILNSIGTNQINSPSNDEAKVVENKKKDPKAIKIFDPVKYDRDAVNDAYESLYCDNVGAKPSVEELKTKHNLSVDENLYENYQEVKDEEGNSVGFRLRLTDGTDMEFIDKDNEGKFAEDTEASIKDDGKGGIQFSGLMGANDGLKIRGGYASGVTFENCNDFDYLSADGSHSDNVTFKNTKNANVFLGAGKDDVTMDEESSSNIFIKTGGSLSGVGEGKNNLSIVDIDLNGVDDRYEDSLFKTPAKHVVQNAKNILKKPDFPEKEA